MAKHPLKGKAIWITRPAGQAEGITKRIEQAGGKAFVMPVMDIIPCKFNSKDIQQVQNLDQYHQVIFLSTNAVKYGLEQMAEYWPQWPVGIQWWAVGQATARTMSDFGINAKTPHRQSSSEGLIEALATQPLSDQKIIIVCGINGRKLLPDTLYARGAEVSLFEVYKRQISNPAKKQRQELENLINNDQLSVVLATSVEALDNADRIALDYKLSIRSIPLVVISQRIANAAKKTGFKSVRVAQGIGNDEIMAALI